MIPFGGSQRSPIATAVGSLYQRGGTAKKNKNGFENGFLPSNIIYCLLFKMRSFKIKDRSILYPPLPVTHDDDENLTEEEEEETAPYPPTPLEQGKYLILGKCACRLPYCRIDAEKEQLQRDIFHYNRHIEKKPYEDYTTYDDRDPLMEEYTITIEDQIEIEHRMLDKIEERSDFIQWHDSTMIANFCKHIEAQEADRARRQKKEQLQERMGAREFTLTYSPQWFGDEEARRKMKLAVCRLTKYYARELVNFHAVGEVGENGLSHIHGWYELQGGRKITDKNFKRAYPHWNPKKKLGKGFEGGHHATIGRISNFHAYMEKDVENSWYVYNKDAVQEDSTKA